MVGQKSANCDRRVWRVPVTLENSFSEKKHSVTHVTSVTLWPVYNCDQWYWSRPGHIRDPVLCICVYLFPLVARVTYVTQFCVSVSFSRPGHIRDPILCLWVSSNHLFWHGCNRDLQGSKVRSQEQTMIRGAGEGWDQYHRAPAFANHCWLLALPRLIVSLSYWSNHCTHQCRRIRRPTYPSYSLSETS